MLLFLVFVIGVIFLHGFAQIGIHSRAEEIICTPSRSGIIRILAFLKVLAGEGIVQGHIGIGKAKETSSVVDIELVQLSPIDIYSIRVKGCPKIHP